MNRELQEESNRIRNDSECGKEALEDDLKVFIHDESKDGTKIGKNKSRPEVWGPSLHVL
jgi:hypothetical protein